MCELSCSSSGGNSVVRWVVVLVFLRREEFCLFSLPISTTDPPRVLPGNWLVARVVVDLKKLLPHVSLPCTLFIINDQ